MGGWNWRAWRIEKGQKGDGDQNEEKSEGEIDEISDFVEWNEGWEEDVRFLPPQPLFLWKIF